MRQAATEWTVKMLVDLERRINVEAEYQRGAVWSEAQQRLLIDSLLRGYDIPKIYLRKVTEGGEWLYDVVDGKQRLTALWHYFAGSFRLARSLEIEGLGKLGGKKWAELPVTAQDRLQFAHVTVSVLEDATEEEVSDLFLRLQKGEPLKAAEKRNAIVGPVRDFIRGTLAKHPIFPNLGIADRRYAWHELAAITLCIVIAKGPTAIKGADLTDLYENDKFDPAGPEATTAMQILDDLNTVAAKAPGSIRTRWGFVDLLTCLLRFRREDIRWDPAIVQQAFATFEVERQAAAAKLADLRTQIESSDDESGIASADLPEVDAQMLVYVQSFVREGATADNVRARGEVLYRRLLASAATS